MSYTVYVDSLFGSNINTGELEKPVQTLPYALSIVYDGGVIVLQTGTGTSYGNLTVNKNLTVKSANGASPKIGTITYSGYQGLIEGLFFENLTSGIIVSNLSVGAIIVRGCKFVNVRTPIKVDSTNYISIHRNFFSDFSYGIKISDAVEVCVSSNIFSNGQRSVDVSTVERLDLWRNTIYGSMGVSPVPDPDGNLRVIYKTLNTFDITYKRIQLPGYAAPTITGTYDVAFNVVNGPSFNYGTDFNVIYSGGLITWGGLRLENELKLGDIVRIMYSESSDVESGDAISAQNIGDENSRIDSNSLSGRIILGEDYPISAGVFFNTPVKIRDNNFDMVDVWWEGGIPTGATGINNFGETALYIDAQNEDFRLQSNSPNIDRGDSSRWNAIYSEIGIIKVNDSYTASYTGIRKNISSFDRDLDYSLFHRGATGIQGLTGDIGAFEYNVNETSMGNYVAEYGFDKAYPGTETGPYASIDRGYQRSANNNIYIDTNPVPIQSNIDDSYETIKEGVRYSRYRSKDITLSDSDLIVGSGTTEDIAFVYPSHPSLETGLVYTSPNGNDSWSGTSSAPYRTIEKALSSSCAGVIIEPGYYPSFKGVTGVKLIGVERYKDIGLSGVLYTNNRDGSWTGLGTYSIDSNSLKIIAPSNIMSSFTFGSNIDIKLFVSVLSDSHTIKLSNADNDVYVKLNKNLSVITYGYRTGGTVYEISSSVLSFPYTPEELFSDLKVRFVIKGSKFSIFIDGSVIQGSYSNVFTTGSMSNFYIQFVNSGNGEDTINNIRAFSSSMVGATGVNTLVTLKKAFAITGATGIQS